MSSGPYYSGGSLRRTESPNLRENICQTNNNRQQRNQRRATGFRGRREAAELICLVDGQGDELLVEGGSQLLAERHEAVVAAIYG